MLPSPENQQPVALVVDDDDLVRLLVRQSLERAGLVVVEATNGEDGLRTFERLHPDIVLLDVLMPVMGGFDTCAGIRRTPLGAYTPVLMMTGLDDSESIDAAYEAGATDFVSKPIPWTLLAHRVRYLLRAGEATERLARSEARLAEAQRLAGLGHWDWDLRSGVCERSPELLRLLGASPDALERTYAAFVARVRPDERGTLEQAIARVCERGEALDMECHVLGLDGVERVMHERAVAVRDASGTAVRLYGTTQDITERKMAEQRIQWLALYDNLTGLPNREYFRELTTLTLAQAARTQQNVAVCVLALDRFRRVNETLGHDLGDRLLAAVAARLSRSLRAADRVARGGATVPACSLARTGGDEFVIQLSNVPDAAGIGKVVRRLLSVLARPFVLDAQELVVTASAGIAVYPHDGEDVDTLMQHADSAMRHAKRQGKDNFQFFSPTMNVASLQKLTMETMLRRALERGEFVLHYQPKVTAAARRIVGVEALLRWRHPQRGMVPPDEFIPLAEEMGLILPIGDWVLTEACRQAAAWKSAGVPVDSIAVNMASPNFAQKDFVAKVARALQHESLAHGAIEIELTESILMHDVGRARETLHALKELGLRLSIDDFGTGYSSLAYLKRFPIDTLKIDRAFVREVTVNAEDAAIVRAVVALAASLGLAVVAEGVETEDQARFLRATGCDHLQGYLFSRPVAADEIAVMLLSGVRSRVLASAT